MTGYAPTEVEAAVRLTKVVLLKARDRENAYAAFFSPTRDAFFVAVITVEPTAFEDGLPVIAEILSLEDYEALGGELELRDRRRAAALVLDPVALRSWETRHLGQEFVRPQPRVVVCYTAAGGAVKRWYLKRAPVCGDFIDAYGLENSLGHPGFLPWFSAQLTRAGIDPAQVVSLEIIEAVRMRLRVAAEDHACPNCQLMQEATDSEEEEGTAIGRFFSRLIGRAA
ncbi:hypothetical protein [Paraburkholderia sp. J8-2]|uniref:hypothetical protein n=1 Tax=Paraburkholderia sp. J8-2 TaxID=2805440 RepID=UPI002AB7C930|nr:hypothetical protein [Paraburkholderia sp. J8-2]